MIIPLDHLVLSGFTLLATTKIALDLREYNPFDATTPALFALTGSILALSLL
jgi:hypothetical protein